MVPRRHGGSHLSPVQFVAVLEVGQHGINCSICLVPVCDVLLICDHQKEALWDKSFMAAPRPRTRSEQL
jgi:hypothetical protein